LESDGWHRTVRSRELPLWSAWPRPDLSCSAEFTAGDTYARRMRESGWPKSGSKENPHAFGAIELSLRFSLRGAVGRNAHGHGWTGRLLQ
jgi:hypothetical protein